MRNQQLHTKVALGTLHLFLMKFIKLLVLSASVLACVPAVAQWQWVDKDGRKVFSDRPPGLDVPEKNIVKRPKGYGSLNGITSSGTGPSMREVAAPAEDGEAPAATPTADSAPPTQSAPTGKDKNLEAKKAAEDKAKADAEKAEKAKIAAAKAENCRMATQAKAQMDTGKAVRRPNDKGEMVFLNDAQRSAEAARIDKIIGSDCKH